MADFKTRKMIANGIFLSKLSFMISSWGSCPNYLINSLQVIQNKVLRIVTRNDWTVRTNENLKQLGWLSVNQRVHFFDILMLHQVKNDKTPQNLYNMYDWSYSHQTRQASSEVIKPAGTPKLEISKRSFRWRASESYNKLPNYITKINDILKFKEEVKSWIISSVPIRR